MRSLRLKNFRSLVDTGPIELRPLTILVGANSSGKSSFLRFFPLLRQTYEARSASPLLWFGRDVDFGDFSQVVRRGAEPKEIEVEIGFDVRVGTGEVMQMQSTTTLAEIAGKTHVVRYELSCGTTAFTVGFTPEGTPRSIAIAVNGKIIHEDGPAHLGRYTVQGALIPWQEQTKGGSSFLYVHAMTLSEHAFLNLLDGKLKSETIERLWRDLEYGTSAGIARSLADRRGGKAAARVLLAHPARLEQIRAYDLVLSSGKYMANVSDQVEEHATRCVYVGPFRTPPERFYRGQELSTGRLEPHGENLAMFLRSLSSKELESFASFMAEHLGFRVVLRTEASHVIILLQDEAGQAHNLMDMGYGFSQILPVVAQCWATSGGRRSPGRESLPSIVTIEQPELHLHPRYQARLADMFVGTMHAARDAWMQIPRTSPDKGAAAPQLIIETHSEALVSRLGELVEVGKLSADDVSVLLFEQDPVTKDTTVRQSTFSPDGTLTNWPVGFFAP